MSLRDRAPRCGLPAPLEHEREEAAEHVAADGLVELVEDRTGFEQVLGGSEGLLHGPQLLVAEHGFERVEIGVGAQHENAVEPFLVFDLVRVDREVLIADRLQVAPTSMAPMCRWRSRPQHQTRTSMKGPRLSTNPKEFANHRDEGKQSLYCWAGKTNHFRNGAQHTL